MAQNIDIVISAKDTATKSINDTKKAIQGLSSSVEQMKGIAGSAFSIMKTGALALGTAITGLGAFGVKAGADMEQVNIAFKTLYGNADQARETLTKLADFAAATPFEFPELADSALKLQNIAGIAKEQLIPTLTSLGDIAASQGKGINQITEAFNDAIVGEFERLKEFGIKAKTEGDKVTFTYKGQTTVVQKNNEAIAEYITKLGQAQGVSGAMDAQSQTMNGRLSTLKDNFKFLVMELVGVTKAGEIVKGGFFDKISQAIDALGKWMEANKGKIQGFFTAIGNVSSKVAQTMKEWWDVFGEDFKAVFKIVALWLQDNGPTALKYFLNVFKGAMILLGQFIKGLRIIFEGDFFKVMQDGFSELGFFMEKKFDEFVQWFKAFAEQMYIEAKQFALNFLGMIGDGITEGIQGLRDSAAAAAQALKDNLGFGSPTKEGPGKNSDKWMPNLMKMLSSGIDAGEASLRQSAAHAASVIGQAFSIKQFEGFKQKVSEIQGTVKSAFDNLTGKIGDNKGKVLSLQNDYSELKKRLKEIGDEGTKEIARITTAITDQQAKINSTKAEGSLEIAKRALEIEKELADLDKPAEKTEGYFDKRNLLQTELDLAKSALTQGDIANARAESEKSITQNIMERFAKQKTEQEIELSNLALQKEAKIIAIEEEKTAQKILIDAKKAEIISEYELYKSLVEQKKLIDSEYFNLFGVKIARQMDETKQAIALLQSYNSMRGGGSPTLSASSELYKMQTPVSPKSGGVNNVSINMGSVSVQNKSDADYLVQKMKDAFMRETQLFKLGIS